MKLSSVISNRVELGEFLSFVRREVRRFLAHSDSRSTAALRRSKTLGLSPTQQFIIRRDMPRPEKR